MAEMTGPVVVVYRGQRYVLTASGVRRIVTVEDYRPQRQRS
jgi:hypothetical protein